MSDGAESRETSRLHPTSLLFLIGSTVRQLAAPLVAAILFARGGSMLYVVPAALGLAFAVALARFVSYRYRLGDSDLTVREGILFRSERHVPYARIQNLNLVRNPVHRWLGVAEVHIETASGSKPEAVLKVLALDAVERIRERVFHDRAAAGTSTGEASGSAESAAARELVRMSARDIALFGFLSHRGMVVVAAVFGAIWQMLPDDVLGDWSSERVETIRGLIETTVLPTLPRLPGPVVTAALALFGLAVALVVLQTLSVAWGFVKFHGFLLVRDGEDLRAEYGLFTRITATIPRRRVQLVHVREGWLQRRLGYATVQVETAGGAGGGDGDEDHGVQHLWIAPLVEVARVEALREELLPGIELDDRSWRPLADGALGRLTRRNLLLAAAASAVSAIGLGGWAVVPAAIGFPLAIVAARVRVRHSRWAEVDRAVAYRSGWWTRRTSIVPTTKIQVVTLAESPFDRRRRMARVLVDTAGAGRVGHRVFVPYLDQPIARGLHARLASRAAATAFRW